MDNKISSPSNCASQQILHSTPETPKPGNAVRWENSQNTSPPRIISAPDRHSHENSYFRAQVSSVKTSRALTSHLSLEQVVQIVDLERKELHQDLGKGQLVFSED
jgi:hypothetical protein